jgi:hypothetical protein
VLDVRDGDSENGGGAGDRVAARLELRLEIHLGRVHVVVVAGAYSSRCLECDKCGGVAQLL